MKKKSSQEDCSTSRGEDLFTFLESALSILDFTTVQTLTFDGKYANKHKQNKSKGYW